VFGVSYKISSKRDKMSFGHWVSRPPRFRRSVARATLASRWLWWVSLGLGTLGCGPARPAPFSQAETEQALAPAADLRQRCYAGTELERSGVRATLDYDLNVSPDGSARSVPRVVEPDEPRLVECVRHRLDSLRFPARAKDHLSLHFELGPGRSGSARVPPRALLAGTCDPPCGDGFTCHYEGGKNARGECRVETGRCRFDRDCASLQACHRLAEALGVCQERK
jgi:hypothetical protein